MRPMRLAEIVAAREVNMKRRLVFTAGVLMALLLLMALASCRSGQSYRADRFDVNIVVHANGSATISETLTLAFEGGPFTYAFRELPTRDLDGLEGIRVFENGLPYAPGNGPGQYEIKAQGEGLRVTWHFEPSQNTRRTFVLTYEVNGLIRQEGPLDALRWVAIPPQHDYGITRSQVTVQLPDYVGPLSGVRVLDGRAEIGAQAHTALFTGSQIERNQPLAIGLWFPHGQLRGVPPVWQARELAQRSRAPLWLALAALILILGVTGAIWAWRRYGRERVEGPAEAITAPPTDLSPGLAGALLHNGSTTQDIVATLFDLSRQGALAVEQTATSGGRHPRRGFALVPLATLPPLRPWEQATLEAALAGATGPVSLRDALAGLRRRRTALRREFAAELYAQDLFGRRRDRVRRALLVGGGSFMVLGLGSIAVTVLWHTLFGFWPLWVTGALLLTGLAWCVVGTRAARRTAKGELNAGKWRAFREYLRQLARGRALAEQAPLFEQYLPYALAFGLGERWVRQMAAAGGQAPAWFRALEQEVQAASEMAALAALITAASTAAVGQSATPAGGAAGGGASSAG